MGTLAKVGWMFAVFVWFFTIVQFWCKFVYNDNGDKEIQYVVFGPRKSAMPLVRDFSENDKIFRGEKKYVE